MKLVTYDDGKVGHVDGEEIVRLDVPTMREWFERGGADETGERTPLAEAKLRAPIVPKKFFHTAGNFREHEEESKNVDWTHRIAPWINFFQNVDAIIGPDEPIVYPEHLTEELDYELELAVVLKKAGKWFSPDEAEDYIGGYVIFNDITARDIQRGEMRSGVFSFCKAIDTFCPLGPWIVTPDEIPDPHDLAMELRVNGEQRQESNTSHMSVTIPEILSNFSALGYSAGDVLSTGTVAGVAGFKSEEERKRLYLKPGDVVEAEIERIGVLRNPVVSWEDGHGEPAPPRIRPWGDMMAWTRDDAKLDRVRELMAEAELDALVVRAPDNVLYLTSFWGMKGYDACVFPREGEPVLITIEASEEDAARTAWTDDVRLIRGYDPEDPRPPFARTLDAAVEVARDYERVGLELSLGTQASDRMVGEPTTFTAAWFDAFAEAADATPLLVRARAIKTEQELERLRLANELAAAAMDHVRELLRPGMREAQVAALWQGFVHGEGTGYHGKVELALPFSLVWAGRGIKTFTATGDLPVVEGEPVLFEIWVCADGYWADHTKNLVVGELKPEYVELETTLMDVYDGALEHIRPGAPMAELDRQVREQLHDAGYAGQPTHPICHGVGARAHEPPYPHQAGGGEFEEGMVLAVEPGAYWAGGGGLRVEDNFLVTSDGVEKLSSFPDGVVRCPT